MGFCREFDIQFEPCVPTFAVIKEQFNKQTGLKLRLEATVNLPVFTPIPEIAEAILRDFPQVKSMREEGDNLMKRQDYEQAAKWRDEKNSQLESSTYVKSIDFVIPDFYSISCTLRDERTFSFDDPSPKFRYGYESFLKTLVDLGGICKDLDYLYFSKWQTLKPWDEYHWYNRPRK